MGQDDPSYHQDPLKKGPYLRSSLSASSSVADAALRAKPSPRFCILWNMVCDVDPRRSRLLRLPPRRMFPSLCGRSMSWPVCSGEFSRGSTTDPWTLQFCAWRPRLFIQQTCSLCPLRPKKARERWTGCWSCCVDPVSDLYSQGYRMKLPVHPAGRSSASAGTLSSSEQQYSTVAKSMLCNMLCKGFPHIAQLSDIALAKSALCGLSQ